MSENVETLDAEYIEPMALQRRAPMSALDVMPAISIDQAVERYNMFKEFVSKVLVVDSDYGKIPGTGKDTLYKSGAEKLCMFFGLSVRLRLADAIEDWTGADRGNEPFFYYRYACDLYKGDVLFATSEGSCNSRETKYRYRAGERKCPKCDKPAIIKGKADYGGGWLCFGKKGGCGAKFADNDTSITGQSAEKTPNPDVADLVNTLQKMAEKRAFVGTTLLAVNASAYFTQDMEDMPREHYAEPSAAKPSAKPAAKPRPKETQHDLDPTEYGQMRTMYALLTGDQYDVERDMMVQKCLPEGYTAFSDVDKKAFNHVMTAMALMKRTMDDAFKAAK